MGDKTLEQLTAAITPLQEALSSESSEPTEQIETDPVEDTEIEASSDSPESSEGVNDTDVNTEEADETGVSYKNRFSEATRKLQRLESRLLELEGELKSSKQVPVEQTISALRASPTATPQIADIPSKPLQEVDMDAPVTRAEFMGGLQSVALRQQQIDLDTAVVRDYPELNDHKSELFAETIARIEHSKRMGRNPNDPRLLLDAVEAATFALIKAGKRTFTNKKADESVRRQAATGQKTLTSRGAVTQTASQTKLSNFEKDILKRFQNVGVKVDPAKYIKRKNS